MNLVLALHAGHLPVLPIKLAGTLSVFSHDLHWMVIGVVILWRSRGESPIMTVGLAEFNQERIPIFAGLLSIGRTVTSTVWAAYC